MSKDSLGDRMKRYESVTQSTLTPRMPAIIRVDGRAFHSFTRGFDYPFDQTLSSCMQEAAFGLLRDIPTAALAYGQSDEISILLIDYSSLQSEQWFGGKIQKIVSVAASLATLNFNRAIDESRLYPQKTYDAMFDARVFSLPESDVGNYFYWRWKDASRNSVSMAARAHFSHRELHGVDTAGMKQKLRYEANEPWEDMPEFFKDGWVIRKEPREGIARFEWNALPIREDIRSIAQGAIAQMKEGLEDEQEEKEQIQESASGSA